MSSSGNRFHKNLQNPTEGELDLKGLNEEEKLQILEVVRKEQVKSILNKE